MFFFQKKENQIEKYEITFNKEELEKFRIKVINDCSEIKHHKYEANRDLMIFNPLIIRNYKSEKKGYIESHDVYSESEIIYQIEYDEYVFPYLVSLIDRLLKEDAMVIDEILYPDYSLENIPIIDRINQVSMELDKIDNLKVYEKKKKLEELIKLIDLQKLNSTQKSVHDYYDFLKQMLSINLIDTLPIKDFNRVKDFFEDKNISKDILFMPKLNVRKESMK